MARSNYSAGKRQREAEKAKKRKEKAERKRRSKQGGGGGVEIASVEDLQGGLMSIDEVVQGVHSKGPIERSTGVPTRLFVGGLDWRVDTDQLRKTFETIGEVLDAAVVLDRDTGDSRGFGFVTMRHQDAAAAIEKLTGLDLEGRTLVVRPATERRR